MRTFGRRIEHDLQQRGSGDAIGERMVHPSDQGAASAAEAFDDINLPHRNIAVHHLVHQPSGQSFEFTLAARSREFDPEDVLTNVEPGVVFPCGVAEIEWRRDHNLAVSWN